MKKHETYESVPGILRPFKAFIEEKRLPPGSHVVFYGAPGTCTPFIELLAFSIRNLPLEQIYVPLINEAKAKRLKLDPDAGMQVMEKVEKINPTVVVLLGGLSMPSSGVSAHEVHRVVGKYCVPYIGVCFMKMFEKAGWTKVFDFDLLIDANIAPVDVWKAM